MKHYLPIQKMLLITATVLFLIFLSITAHGQNRTLTRGALEGELYFSTTTYVVFDQYGFVDELYSGIVRFTDNGKHAEVVYQVEDPFDGQENVMMPASIIADAAEGVVYNADGYTVDDISRRRLWVSFDYGKTWECRDTAVINSIYFGSNIEGLIYRGGGGI